MWGETLYSTFRERQDLVFELMYHQEVNPCGQVMQHEFIVSSSDCGQKRKNFSQTQRRLNIREIIQMAMQITHVFLPGLM